LLPNSSGPSPFANVGDYRFRLRIVRDMDLFSLYLVDPFGDASVLVNQYSNAAVGSAPALQVGLFAMDLEGGNLSAEFDYLSVQAVPVPASIWLFGSVVALAAFRHRRRTRVA
jgi:hypothetical protein